MKIFYKINLVFFLLVFCQTIQAQTKVLNLQEGLSNYFELPREQIYLHLNKSTYIAGESLWFKGYIWDVSEKIPSVATKNLEVSLHNSAGELVKKKLFLGEKGQVAGQFEIDSLLVPGDYYIEGTTNWLRNFGENHNYVQHFRILGNEDTLEEKKAVNEVSYDLQFMPEGGHLVEGLNNSIGLKLIDSNGKGVAFREGIVLDNTGNTVCTFESNPLGLGKFSLDAGINTQYSAKIILNNGSVVEAKFTKAEKEGLALRVVNVPGEYLYLQLNTNQSTYNRISDRPFHIVYHQEGKSSLGEMSFSDNKLSLTTRILKSELYDGVNTITIADYNGNPVLERLIFNDTRASLEGMENTPPEIEKVGDSILFRFKLRKESNLKPKIPYNLSVSVLPENTISYSPQDNIYLSFLLKPYVRGFIENPSYYFSDNTQRKRDDLDLLLLTQGWSRYEWDAILSSPPKAEYSFEQGISVRTSIQKEAFLKEENKSKEGSKNEQGEVQFYIHPIGEQEQIITAVGEDNLVLVDNLYLTEGEKLRTSIITPSGRMIKSGNNLEISPKKEVDQLKVPNTLHPKSLGDFAVNNNTNDEDYLKEFITEKVTVLDEVVVKQRVEKGNSEGIQLASFLNNDRRKTFPITAEEVDLFPNVLDIIRLKGFDVNVDPNSNLVRVVQRFSSTFNSSSRIGENRLSPILIIDDVIVLDFELLRNLRTYDIEDIYVNPRDNSQGARGAGGLIRINRRRTPIDYSILSRVPKVINYTETALDLAFQSPRKFYNPVFNSYANTAFDNYGTVHWEPNIITDIEGNFVVKTPLIPNKSYTFYFEGMSESGGLISKKVTWKSEIAP